MEQKRCSVNESIVTYAPIDVWLIRICPSRDVHARVHRKHVLRRRRRRRRRRSRHLLICFIDFTSIYMFVERAQAESISAEQ